MIRTWAFVPRSADLLRDSSRPCRRFLADVLIYVRMVPAMVTVSVTTFPLVHRDLPTFTSRDAVGRLASTTSQALRLSRLVIGSIVLHGTRLDLAWR